MSGLPSQLSAQMHLLATLPIQSRGSAAPSFAKGPELPFAAVAHRKILGRCLERPVTLRSPFEFASAANGGSPPSMSGGRAGAV